MGLGARISERLEELGISQSELARRTGVPQTTINSLIKAGRRSTPHLLKLSRALRTTPAYLTGETDDPEGEDGGLGALGTQDRELLDCFHELNASDRKAVLRITRALVAAQSAEGATLHSRKSAFRGFEGE